MIYLIGGAPRCGKTILSEKLSADRHLSWISTDIIRVSLLAYIPESEIEAKLPDQNRRIETNTSEELLESELVESETLWPGVCAIIKYLIDCQQEYVIEGVHLMPKLVQQLQNTSYWSQIKLVFLVKSDLQDIKEGLVKNTAKHDWLKDLLADDKLLEKAARMVQMKSVYIAEQARICGYEVIDTGVNFEQKISELSKDF